MKVILLENVKRIGSIGEVIDVKRGFARNFLIANKKEINHNKILITGSDESFIGYVKNYIIKNFKELM